ncbi:MAG: peptide deformylase [Chthonomonadales bacterium]
MPVVEAPRGPARVEIEIPPDIARIWNERNDGIVKYPHEVLRRPAAPVPPASTASLRSPALRASAGAPGGLASPMPAQDVRGLIHRMTQAMITGNGVGLAAPQIGVSLRVLVYRLPVERQGEQEVGGQEFEPVRVLINPKIVHRKGEQVGPEGCLSIPFLRGDVPRAYEIVVKALDHEGRPVRRRASAFEARVIQHEVDHLDGILFIDRADPSTLHWLIEEEGEAPIED